MKTPRPSAAIFVGDLLIGLIVSGLILAFLLLLSTLTWAQTVSIQIQQPPITPQTWTDAAGNSFTLTGMPAPVQIATLAATLAAGAQPLPDGTYNFIDVTHALAMDDGFSPIGLYASINDSGQKIVWASGKLGCLVPAGCATAKFIKEGTGGVANLDSVGDPMTIASTTSPVTGAVVSGYTIKDNTTGHYLGSLGVSGASKVSFTATPYIWTVVKR